MKLFFCFIFFCAQTFAGLPPTTLKGQSETSPVTTFNYQVPYNQATTTDGATRLLETGYKNYLLNPSFEHSTATTSWTTTAGTPTADTTNFIDGKKALSISLSAVTGTVIDQSITPSTQVSGVNLEHWMWVKTSLTTLQVCSLQASTEIQCSTVPSTNTWQKVPLFTSGPSSGTIGVRLKTTGSTTGTVIIDDAYVGPAVDLGAVAQAQFIGSVKYVGVASCIWATTSTSLANFSAQASCNYGTATQGSGTVAAPGTKIPAIVASNLPPGNYKVTAVMNVAKAGTVDAPIGFALNDGTTTTPAVSAYFNSTNAAYGYPATAVGYFNYSSSQSSITFQVQGVTSSASNNAEIISNSSGLSDFSISIEYFPTSSQLALNSNNTPASWSGYHGATCNWSATSVFGTFADPSDDGTCTLTERSNTNFGTVTTYGAAKPGITFTPPTVGKYWICATSAGFNATNGAYNGYQLFDGTNEIAVTEFAQPTGINSQVQSFTLCGIFNATSIASTSIRIKGAVSSGTNNWGAWQTGTTAVDWSIFQITSAFPAPLLVGSVTSNTSGMERVERAVVTPTSGAACTIVSQSGSWLTSATPIAAGECTVSIASGKFTSAPTCTCSTQAPGGITRLYGCRTNTISTSALTINVNYMDSGSSAVQGDTGSIDLICMGPR